MTALHHFETWPGYVTTTHEYNKGEVMLCLDVICGTLRINVNLDTLNDALNVDNIIFLLSNAYNTK